MRGTRTIALAGVSALALLTAACNGGGSSTTSGSGGEHRQHGGAAGGEISIVGCTPQNPFIPAMTNETCGGDMLDEVPRAWSTTTARPRPPRWMAESIETTGQPELHRQDADKFSDGTEIKARTSSTRGTGTAPAPTAP